MLEPQRILARAERSLTKLEELFGLFGEAAPAHQAVNAGEVPEPQRSLLDHERHMTVTLERHHATKLRLTVLDHILEEPFYARKILLHRQDNAVVQYGIMRFDLRRVRTEVRDLIVAGEIPLGRILIENEVLRRISMHGLLALRPSTAIKTAIGTSVEPATSETLAESTADAQGSSLANAAPLYGRLATILCNESPAVDLLEVVALPG